MKILLSNSKDIDNYKKYTWDTIQEESIFNLKNTEIFLSGFGKKNGKDYIVDYKEIDGIKESFINDINKATEIVLDLTDEYFIKYAPFDWMVETNSANITYSNISFINWEWYNELVNVLYNFSGKIFILYKDVTLYDASVCEKELFKKIKNKYTENLVDLKFTLDTVQPDINSEKFSSINFVNILLSKKNNIQKDLLYLDYVNLKISDTEDDILSFHSNSIHGYNVFKSNIIERLSEKEKANIKQSVELGITKKMSYDNGIYNSNNYFKINENINIYIEKYKIYNIIPISYLTHDNKIYIDLLGLSYRNKKESENSKLFLIGYDESKQLCCDYFNKISILYTNLNKLENQYSKIKYLAENKKEELLHELLSISKLNLNYSELNNSILINIQNYIDSLINEIKDLKSSKEFNNERNINRKVKLLYDRFDEIEKRLYDNDENINGIIDKCIDYFGSQQWNKLSDEAQRMIISGEIIYERLKGTHGLEYSPAVIPLTKAIENILNYNLYYKIKDEIDIRNCPHEYISKNREIIKDSIELGPAIYMLSKNADKLAGGKINRLINKNKLEGIHWKGGGNGFIDLLFLT